MPTCVRFAQQRDLGAIEKVENKADRLLIDQFNPDDWSAAPPGDVRASKPGFLHVVEVDDGNVVGFVHVVEVRGICHLEQLSVAPEHARQGWGRTLVEAAKYHARNRGYLQISLRTYADIPWNAPFYETVGFIEEEPTTQFHRSLIAVEAELGLDLYGRRVHMVASLASACVRGSIYETDLAQIQQTTDVVKPGHRGTTNARHWRLTAPKRTSPALCRRGTASATSCNPV